MNADDDIVVNTRVLYKILQHNSDPNFTLGKVLWFKPVRSREEGKFYTPESIYPNASYPPYFQGHASILSTEIAERVYHKALETTLLPWADVFIGVCLQKLKIRPRHSQLFAGDLELKNKTNLLLTENALDNVREYISAVHVSKALMNQLWDIWNL